MLSEINESLFRIVKEKREQEKLTRQKRQLTNKLKQTESLFEKDEASYLKKYRQLSQLEKARLDKWLPPIGNFVEKKIDRCKALKISLNELKVQISEIKKQLVEIDQLLENIGNIEKLYKELMKIKETYLHESDNPNKQALLNQEEIIANIKVDIKEIQEALSAGKGAIKGLQFLERVVSTTDLLDDSGIVTFLYMQYKERKVLNNNIGKVQQALQQFEKEVMDVMERMDIPIAISQRELSNFSKGFILQLGAVSVFDRGIKQTLRFTKNTQKKIIRSLKTFANFKAKKERDLRRQIQKKESFIRDV